MIPGRMYDFLREDKWGKDFTQIEYSKLLDCVIGLGYTPITVEEYIARESRYDIPDQALIIRHDIDRKAHRALRMASIEHEKGIRSSYYFRYPNTFKKRSIVDTIRRLNHEIGYHYETNKKARGNVELALQLFAKELAVIRTETGYDVKTVCMHGSPLSKYDNNQIWNLAKFSDYGLIGDAFLSFETGKVFYFSDTGRSWNETNSRRDRVKNNRAADADVSGTNSLIEFIERRVPTPLYLNVHPERWSMNKQEWIQDLFTDVSVNIVKKIVKSLNHEA